MYTPRSLLALGLITTGTLAWNDQRPSVIVLIPDGMGPSQSTFTREVQKIEWNVTDLHHKLVFDPYLVGTIQSKSASGLVTDSAASGSAYATGVNTYNGAISVDADGAPQATNLEGAKAQGYWTGLVSTTDVTDATPAVWSSHVLDRGSGDVIASQQLGGYALGRQVDLLWGGGRGWFLPQSDDDSERTDVRDLVQEARDAGWNVVLNDVEFQTYAKENSLVKRNRFARRNNDASHLPSLGLFAPGSMNYEIDRVEGEEPALHTMAVAALEALHQPDAPFFAMIESARIDHSAHANDGPTLYREVTEYERTYKAVYDWVQEHKHERDFIVIAMADHDTGGLVLDGSWKPAGVLNSTASVEFLSDWVEESIEGLGKDEVKEWIRDEVIYGKLGLASIEDENLDAIVTKAMNETSNSIAGLLSDEVNDVASLYWGSGGHTEVDINLFHYATLDYAKAEELPGSHPNKWIGQWIGDVMQIDRSSINAKIASVDLGPAPEED